MRIEKIGRGVSVVRSGELTDDWGDICDAVVQCYRCNEGVMLFMLGKGHEDTACEVSLTMSATDAVEMLEALAREARAIAGEVE